MVCPIVGTTPFLIETSSVSCVSELTDRRRHKASGMHSRHFIGNTSSDCIEVKPEELTAEKSGENLHRWKDVTTSKKFVNGNQNQKVVDRIHNFLLL